MLTSLQRVQVDDDMFGPGTAAPAGAAPVVKKGLLDNYDDVEGYYNFQVGSAHVLMIPFWSEGPKVAFMQ